MLNSFILLLDIVILFWLARTIFSRQPEALKNYYWPAFSIKIVMGIAVGCVYFFHYGQGDTISYWEDGKVLASKMISDPGPSLSFFWDETSEPQIQDVIAAKTQRSLFFIKIVGLLSFLSCGSYWMISAVMSFVSFLAAWFLFKKTVELFPDSKLAAAAAFLFYPSVVFWSSGLIKESLGLAAIFFLAGILLTTVAGKKVTLWMTVVAILALWVGWNLKYYWLGVFMPVALATLVVIRMKRSRPGLTKFEIPAWMALLSGLLLIGTSIHPNFYPNRFIDVIWENNRQFGLLTNPDHLVQYEGLEPTWLSVLTNSPKALVAGLFRPFIGESYNLFSIVAAIENLILVFLVLTALPSIPKFFKSPQRLLSLSVVTYIKLLAIFLALSTPNLGTLSRYKVGFLPFLVFLVVYENRLFMRWRK